MRSIEFCRAMLKEVHKDVKMEYPKVNLKSDAWVWHAGRGLWEFHGPEGFYWYGTCSNAYDARAKGWATWLSRKRKGLL